MNPELYKVFKTKLHKKLIINKTTEKLFCLQRMEVCKDQTMDKLLRGGLHPPTALQHPPYSQVHAEPAQTNAWQGKESFGQGIRLHHGLRVAGSFKTMQTEYVPNPHSRSMLRGPDSTRGPGRRRCGIRTSCAVWSSGEQLQRLLVIKLD